MNQNEFPREVSLGPTPAGVPLSDFPVVQLTDQQLQEAKSVACRRSESYESIDGGRVHGEQSCQDAHLTGVVGELAVAQLYDGTVDREVYERGDDGHDLAFGRTTIDVKTTQTTAISRPDLIIPDLTRSRPRIITSSRTGLTTIRFEFWVIPLRTLFLTVNSDNSQGRLLTTLFNTQNYRFHLNITPRNALKTYSFSREK